MNTWIEQTKGEPSRKNNSHLGVPGVKCHFIDMELKIEVSTKIDSQTIPQC